MHWTFSAATLQILFMLKQQHYTLTNVKKVKSQSTTPLRPMPCPGFTLLRRARRNQKGYCQPRSSPAPSSGPHHQSPLPLHQPIRQAVHPITNTFLGLNALSSIPLTLPLVLANQGPTPLSRCYETASGGPIWPGMWEGSCKAAPTAPSPKVPVTSLLANFSHYPYLTVPGHT